jgi:hypothetical protein
LGNLRRPPQHPVRLAVGPPSEDDNARRSRGWAQGRPIRRVIRRAINKFGGAIGANPESRIEAFAQSVSTAGHQPREAALVPRSPKQKNQSTEDGNHDQQL